MQTTTARLREKAAPLRERLGRLRSAARRHILVRGASLIAIAASWIALASFLVDWTFYLERSPRGIILAVAIAGLLYFVVRRILLPLAVSLPDDDLALAVEREYPELRESLINAVQFSEYRVDFRHDVSLELMEAVEDEAREATGRVDFLRTLDDRRRRWTLAAAVFSVIVVGTPAIIFPAYARLWFQRTVLLSEEEWERKTSFTVRGFDDRRIWVPKGGDFAVIAEAKGLIPRRVVIRYRYESGTSGKAVMHRLGRNEFKHEFHRILEPIRFHLRGGDGRTSPHTIDVVERPRVEEILLTGHPPAYTREAPIHVRQGHPEVRLPAGSDLKIAGKATKAIVEATVRLGEEAHPAKIAGERLFTLELSPKESAPLEVRLKDPIGLEDDRPVRMHVRIVNDRPPKLKLRLQGIGDMVTPQAVVPAAIHLEDDYGIDSADLLWKISSGEGEAAIPLGGVEEGTRLSDLPYRWELSPLSLPTEQFLTFRVAARDYRDLPGTDGPNVGSSETYTLKVVTIDEFSTEMIRRQQEQRRELERVLAREKKDRDILRSLAAEEAPDSKATAKALETNERSQRLAVRQADGIADRLGQILDEMLNNRVAEIQDARLIADKVIDPLRALAEGPMTESAEEIAEARASADHSPASLLKKAETYDRIVTEMERILSNMLRIEGFTEIIARVRTIIQVHTEAREEAERLYRKKIEELFKEF